MKPVIIPGILTDSRVELQTKLSDAATFCERVHIDVIDGIFADNITVLPEDMDQLDFANLAIDVHLMTESPIDHLGLLKTLGVERVLAQIERMHRIEEFVEEAHEVAITIGLALDLYTPVGALEGIDLSLVDSILLMSVLAGHSGQQHEHVLGKITHLRADGYVGHIIVDGGMHDKSVGHVLEAGADQFVVTSWMWDTDKAGDRYEQLVSTVGA